MNSDLRTLICKFYDLFNQKCRNGSLNRGLRFEQYFENIASVNFS